MKWKTRNWILAGFLVLSAAGILLPTTRARGMLIWQKLAGSSPLPWREVIVRLAPWSYQDRMRSFLGSSTPHWWQALDYPLNTGELKRISHQIFLGPTPNLPLLDCHYTILQAGVSPHPPHQHAEEEMLMPMNGQVEIIRLTSLASEEQQVEMVSPGQLVYHPSGQIHTIRASHAGPSSYLILRWRGEPQTAARPLGASTFDYRESVKDGLASSKPRHRTLLFESPTLYLERLHVHISTAKQGAGSDAHRDEHDVAVVVLNGKLDILGETVKAPAISYHPAHRLHGFRALPGASPAQYIAIEFHRRVID